MSPPSTPSGGKEPGSPFDPFGWASAWVPERWLHRGIRWAGAAFFAAFLVLRVRQYPAFALKPLWLVETVLFVALGAAFVVRADPVDRARGVREILVPWVGGLLPFALLLSPPNPWVYRSRALLLGTFWWMTAATALTVWGVWTLRRSFSLTVEARAPVTGGPYRFLRHPIYTGEVLTAAAVAFWRLSAANLALVALFALVQHRRARWEEAKLARNFPEYEAYRGDTAGRKKKGPRNA